MMYQESTLVLILAHPRLIEDEMQVKTWRLAGFFYTESDRRHGILIKRTLSKHYEKLAHPLTSIVVWLSVQSGNSLDVATSRRLTDGCCNALWLSRLAS